MMAHRLLCQYRITVRQKIISNVVAVSTSSSAADGTASGIPDANQCVTQKRIETEENKYIVEQSPTSDVCREVIEYLNQKTGKRFKPELMEQED